MDTPRKRNSDKKLILLVLGFLFGSVLIWGLSMWMLKVNIRRTVMLIIVDRERLKSLEPWIYQAQRHPLSYQDAALHLDAAVGKAVVWEIHIPTGAGGPAYAEADASKVVHWVNPEKVELRDGHGSDGRTFTVVAVVKSADESGVSLQFLGFQ